MCVFNKNEHENASSASGCLFSHCPNIICTIRIAENEQDCLAGYLPDVPRVSFAARPKTLYRVGDNFGRIEEELDPDRNVQGLTIVTEPKIWVINLRNKTGLFMIDPGPLYVFRAPVIPPGRPGQEQPLKDFEFGREY